jgi:hypothetical protein
VTPATDSYSFCQQYAQDALNQVAWDWYGSRQKRIREEGVVSALLERFQDRCIPEFPTPSWLPGCFIGYLFRETG